MNLKIEMISLFRFLYYILSGINVIKQIKFNVNLSKANKIF